MFTIILFLVSKVDVSANLDWHTLQVWKRFFFQGNGIPAFIYFAKIPSNL